MKKFPSIAPLFWLKGEDSAVLTEGLAKLREAEIYECIVEARPFDGWLEKPWFDVLKTLFAEAEATGMRLWLFDDVHFPSGYAGGRIPEHLRKQLLRHAWVDVSGAGGKYSVYVPIQEGETLFKAVAAPFAAPDGFDSSEAFEISEKIENGKFTLQLPAGRYRIFFFFITRDGGEPHTREWANMIDPEATDTFINVVLETHYKELKEYFDNGVMAGFFSDEPRMGSINNYTSLPGNDITVCYPYSAALAEKLSDQPAAFWPSLWHNCTSAPVYRTRYMEEVSTLYSENFPQKMGKWCRAHGVQYIGHVIEEQGAHCHLGYGVGHFFRGLAGQDFAMIDSVLHQNIPGLEEGCHSSTFKHNGDFLHWGLGKLASSAAHLYPEFNGQAVMESFGAYGWRFNLDAMKRMTDHFASRGVNAFVPHAFSNAEFPDPDCPPHFYARGKNPQWQYFPDWSRSCRNICEILTGGIHVSGAAILYHAEAEWSSQPFTPFEKVGAKLQKRHFDYDTVPLDILRRTAVQDGKLKINGEVFELLIVPEGFLLPEYEAVISNLQDAGLKVFRGDNIDAACKYLFSPVEANAPDYLRTYCYRKNEILYVYMVNESMSENAEFQMTVDGSYLYDPVYDKRFAWRKDIRLVPGESIFAVCAPDWNAGELPEFPAPTTELAAWEMTVDEKSCTFELNEKPVGRIFLECLQNEGVLEIELNGHKYPGLFAPPYRLDITDAVKAENNMKINLIRTPDIPNILEYDIPRNLSMFFKITSTDGGC